jgi:hypothetical protein
MTDPQRAVDVDRLVEELRDRVAAQRAAGAYAVDPSALPLELPPPEPPVRFRPERGYSSKPLVGRPLTLVKQAILRLLIHVFDDLAEQTSSAIDADRRALAAWSARAGRRRVRPTPG